MSDQKFVLSIGRPHSDFEGMNTTDRRQQLAPSQFHMLRNVLLSGSALQKRKGLSRLLSGARRAKSLKSPGDAGTYVTIPYSDNSVNISEFDLGTDWTIFCSYTPNDLSDDILVASHSDNADNATTPWRIVHNTNGSITARCSTTTNQTTTVTTPAKYPAHRKVDLTVYRSGATLGIQPNDAAAVTESSTLSATSNTLVSTEAIYLASWSGRASGSAITYYEFRILRRADTSKNWRITEYPWSGRFGDPDLALHLIFGDGSGTAITDYSRTNHSSIALSGSWTWLSTTNRQVVTPITGIHVMENARGRKWLLVDAGVNHYRVPLKS
jgi:hypothetical protein